MFIFGNYFSWLIKSIAQNRGKNNKFFEIVKTKFHFDTIFTLKIIILSYKSVILSEKYNLVGYNVYKC